MGCEGEGRIHWGGEEEEEEEEQEDCLSATARRIGGETLATVAARVWKDHQDAAVVAATAADGDCRLRR